MNQALRQKNVFDEIVEDTAGLITHILELSVDDSISPHLDSCNDPDLIGKMMFSNGSVNSMEPGEPEVLMPAMENPRIKSIRNKERYYKDKDGNAVSKARPLSVARRYL